MERMLLRVPEVAAQLCVSRGKVYELIRSGRLRSVKAGRRRLVPVSPWLSTSIRSERRRDPREAASRGRGPALGREPSAMDRDDDRRV